MHSGTCLQRRKMFKIEIIRFNEQKGQSSYPMFILHKKKNHTHTHLLITIFKIIKFKMQTWKYRERKNRAKGPELTFPLLERLKFICHPGKLSKNKLFEMVLWKKHNWPLFWVWARFECSPRVHVCEADSLVHWGWKLIRTSKMWG